MADVVVTTASRVAVVDDHRMLAQMMVAHLVERGYLASVVDVDEKSIPLRLIELQPDLVLLDAVFGDDEDGGMDVLIALADSGLRCAILTGVSEEIRHAQFLEAGAVAVISKSGAFDSVLNDVELLIAGQDPMGRNRRAALAQKLCSVHASMAGSGEPFGVLSERELATLQALVDGLSVDKIAKDRTVAESTVRSQVRAVLRKLGANSQLEVVAYAARQGMRPSRPD